MNQREREMDRWTWLRNLWEMKEIFGQKLMTYHLPPHLVPNNLYGISVIITGATSGIGLRTAQELAKAGAHVIMACRNTKAASKIACQWKEEAHNSIVPNVEVMELDLLSLSSVRQFAAAWEQRAKALNILINNAGVYLMGEPQKFTDEGLEQHIQVNHIAPAMLSLLLLPSLLRAPSSRIIHVNSVAHHCAVVETKYWNSRIEEHKFSSFKAYGSSKLAHLMFLKILANKLVEQKKTSIQCLAVHPGVVSTNLVPAFQKKSFWMFDSVEGARSVLFCATSAEVEAHLVKGFAYYTCNCKPARMSPHTADMDACLDVWQKTMEILQLNTDYLSHVMTGMCDKS
ncbi:dehydrogenase/reductase SDR family member FEY-like [Macadamia integrifolia]|uniref:dehydrogenase/reductase SDR family member FEY-like n=1 Tax=Macadamia integrifolia TaxID=60698 RepID=UPI001C5318F2|nr:dehydrogenase/reductase SDR family member FEY-like [Macadamia integrifolia]